MSTERSSETTASRTKDSNSTLDVSPWSPLQHGAFRAVWIALVVSNIGTWMQTVGVPAEPPYAELP